jgi:predicted dehydrogenase
MTNTKGKTKVGLIGCGRISKAYCKNIQRQGLLDLVACSDIRREAAEERAREFSIPRVMSTQEMLADPEIGIILNLTVPQAHAPLAVDALKAGKHIYNEKPLGVTRDEAREMQKLARQKNLRIGCAPDTFLGTGLQTCRRLIDQGKIGTPIAAEVLFSLYPGPKSFDSFFWKKGGGILMDMGPYYLTALTTLLGPVKRLAASTRTNPAPVLQQADADWRTKAEVPSHVAAVLDFHSGVTANFTVSYEVTGYYDIHFKIQGTDGTLVVPDPNKFGGPVVITKFGKEIERLEATGKWSDENRGLGMADMDQAYREGRPHRASDEVAYHVLDIMCTIPESSAQGRFIDLQSTMTRPEVMPLE